MPKLARAGVAALAFMLLAGIAGPGCPWFKMMKYQQSRDGFSFDTNDYDAKGPKIATMRLPVAGTVPIDGGDIPVTLLDADQLVRNPIPGDPESVARGEVRFGIFCSPCHGADAVNRGLVGQKFPFVLSLVSDQAKGYSDAYIYTMIRNGRGLMPRYGDRVPPNERWDIVNYVRELQSRPTPALLPVPPIAQNPPAAK